MLTFFHLRAACLILMSTSLIGCANLGGKAVEGTHINYNQAIQNTTDQQLLLNLVRLRYRDTPLFIEISSISAQLSYRASLAASADIRSGADGTGLSGNVQYSETPTVSYTPLQGDDFVKRLLSHIEPDKLVLLANSGWSIERIFRVCVQRMNGLRNAPRASGPTPATAPEYKDFNKFAKLIRQLQVNDALQLTHVAVNKKPVAAFVFDDKRADGNSLESMKSMLGLSGSQSKPLILNRNAESGVSLTTRSLLGSLFYLSQAVVVPAAHLKSGKVTVTKTAKGGVFDWSDMTRNLFMIKSSVTLPDNASVSVFYRGYWFYIEDNDLTSKSTFSFLAQLFALQAGATDSIKPVLTLPIGP